MKQIEVMKGYNKESFYEDLKQLCGRALAVRPRQVKQSVLYGCSPKFFKRPRLLAKGPSRTCVV